MDRRAEARRHAVALSIPERRAVVDRRSGPERRSTLDRRCRPSRPNLLESPSEHVRNAMQLLQQFAADGPFADTADVAAALQRLDRALDLLEPPTRLL
jgi:hypothetical protein